MPPKCPLTCAKHIDGGNPEQIEAARGQQMLQNGVHFVADHHSLPRGHRFGLPVNGPAPLDNIYFKWLGEWWKGFGGWMAQFELVAVCWGVIRFIIHRRMADLSKNAALFGPQFWWHLFLFLSCTLMPSGLGKRRLSLSKGPRQVRLHPMEQHLSI